MGEPMTETRDLGKVLYETDGPIARIVLNWPEKANSQSSNFARAPLSTLMESTSDAQAVRQKLMETGRKPRDLATEKSGG
jgi:enoyl-CoA hydratase/carnithine racemase